MNTSEGVRQWHADRRALGIKHGLTQKVHQCTECDAVGHNLRTCPRMGAQPSRQTLQRRRAR